MVLPYDDVRAIMEGAKSFCGTASAAPSRPWWETPAGSVHNCLSFTWRESRRARHQKKRSPCWRRRNIGLVHTVSNVAEGIGYVCNCCGCCCGILRGITEFGLEQSVAKANYRAAIDADLCIGCGICAERCHVDAIHEVGGVYAVIAERCIGCGLCVTGCSSEAVTLTRLPEAETVHPPADFAAWEQERLRNRGLAD